MNEIDIYLYGVPIVLILITAEVIYSAINNLGYYKLKDSLAGFGLLFGNISISLFTKSSIFFFSLFIYQFKLITINEIFPAWLVWPLTFIVIDFIRCLASSPPVPGRPTNSPPCLDMTCLTQKEGR